MVQPKLERSFDEPYVKLICRCGWTGHDTDIEEWMIDLDRDRAVRRCPDCDEPVPEWGALRPIAGAARIACGPLRESLVEAGFSRE
jgi:hypothetical protein